MVNRSGLRYTSYEHSVMLPCIKRFQQSQTVGRLTKLFAYDSVLTAENRNRDHLHVYLRDFDVSQQKRENILFYACFVSSRTTQ